MNKQNKYLLIVIFHSIYLSKHYKLKFSPYFNQILNMNLAQIKQSSLSIHNSQFLKLWSTQRNINLKLLQQKINQKSIILIGDNNVGKTTLMYYLSGMKLNLVQDVAKKTKQILPEEVYQNFVVNNSPNSATYIPNLLSTSSDQSQLTLIDTPGYGDTKFINHMSNMLTFHYLIQKLPKTSKIHLIFVISEEIFDHQQINQNLRQLAKRFNMDLLKQKGNFSFIFTKTEDDFQDVKEKFVQIIEELKQILQEESDQKETLELVNLIQDHKQEENFFYCFPKKEPVTQEGLQIAKSMLEKDNFVDATQSILNKNYYDNMVTIGSQKLAQFEPNLLSAIQLSFSLLYQGIGLSFDIIQHLHLNLIDEPISQSRWNQMINHFSQSLMSLSVSIEVCQNDTTIQKIIDAMNYIAKNVHKDESIFDLDNSFLQFLNPEILLSHEESPTINFAIYTSSCVKKCLEKSLHVIQTHEQASTLIQTFKGVIGFLDWLGNQWYRFLANVNSSQKINQVVQNRTKHLVERLSSLCTKIKEKKPLYDKIVELAANFNPQQDQSESDQQSLQVQNVNEPDHGYHHQTLSKLKQTYLSLSPFGQDMTLADKEGVQFITQLKQIQQKVRSIILKLQQSVIDAVKDAQTSGSYKIHSHPQKIGLTLFQFKNLRHRLFLESALKNFHYYLKFIIFSLKTQAEKIRRKQLLKDFVWNICLVLSEYSLFEEQVLLLLFANDFEKACTVLAKGIQTRKIQEEFIKNELINNIVTLTQKPHSSRDLQFLSIITCKAYNCMVAQYSFSRQQKTRYQNKMTDLLDKIQEKIKAIESITITNKTQLKNQSPYFDLNYFIIGPKSSFSVKNICLKIQVLEQRNNKNQQIYAIYKHFHPKLTKIKNHQISNQPQ